MTSRQFMRCLILAAFVTGLPAAGHASTIVLSVGGDATLASITPTISLFTTGIGGVNNGNGALAASGRREINWDGGGGVATPTTSGTPFNGFQNTRGALFTTPGTGFIQGQPADLGNAAYTGTFAAFSPLRLFTPVASNITDVTFFVPGSGGFLQTTTSAFGAVFSDVDLANSTRIEMFNAAGASLFSGFVPAGTTLNQSFSFLGVRFDAGEAIARVRITTGTNALGGLETGGIDLVAMDDFIFAEPAAIPEPATLTLLGVGLLFTRAARRLRR